MSFLGLLDKKATIERATSSISDEGYVTNTWNEIGTNVGCRLQKVSGRTYQDESGEIHEADFVAYFACGTDVRPEVSGKADRVKVDGQYYSVIDVRDMAGKQRFLKVLLRKI